LCHQAALAFITPEMVPVRGRFLHGAALYIMLVIVSLDVVEWKHNNIIYDIIIYYYNIILYQDNSNSIIIMCRHSTQGELHGTKSTSLLR
jgi:hypothetical protein